VPVPPTVVDAIDTTSAPKTDYIWVDYIRPVGLNGEPLKVPTIMDASPYYNTLGRGYLSLLKTPFDSSAPKGPNVLGGTDYADFPEWEAHYFVPRGYAIALMDLRGTRNSSGCNVYGDKQEALDAVHVVDWIADQSWSNGKVGMIGGSYDGTIANGTAALYPRFHDPAHPADTLAAVVPIRAIDRWYDYQFFNGVEANGQEADPEEFSAVFPAGDWPNSGPQRAGGDQQYSVNLAHRLACPGIEQIPTDAGYASPYQDTVDGSTSNFWNNRDYLQYASTWKAATFFIHGLYDFNVKTMNTGQLWDALPSSVPKRLWWMNAAHADPDVPTEALGDADCSTSKASTQELRSSPRSRSSATPVSGTATRSTPRIRRTRTTTFCT
jgi:X-Pro dipeptidyl-peptidase